MSAFTFGELAACAAREVLQRRRVYPRLVDKGSMTQAEADRQIAMMDDIRRHFAREAEADPAGHGRLL